ncbi:MAG: 30S ribosomal protein S4 [Elusimicrobia bacterium]|nr:30S ribosomal protein S4 [Elusimicrobiota bacterium]
MSSLRSPVCKLCRREGVKLFLKGEKCFVKCVFEKRPYPPGPSGKARTRKKITDYGLRLREKQRLRRMMGINEAQMRRYYDEAQRLPGRTGENLLNLLELRLDNVVRKIGLAASPRFARQLVGHGHVMVNGKRVTIPSYAVQPGDQIQIDKTMKSNFFVDLAQQNHERRATVMPSWIKWDKAESKGEILRLPEKGEVSFPVNDQYIVEFYTRR